MFFRCNNVKKIYLAICSGIPLKMHYSVEAAIDCDPEHDIARCISKNGKKSLTLFEVIACNEDYAYEDIKSGLKLINSSNKFGVSLIKCIPINGRTHQIRLHLHHNGTPIIGDEIYGFKVN